MRAKRKTPEGRGRSRADWIEWLYSKLLDEIDRVGNLGIKMSYALIIEMARLILVKSTDPRFNQQFSANGQPVL